MKDGIKERGKDGAENNQSLTEVGVTAIVTIIQLLVAKCSEGNHSSIYNY